MSLTAMFVVRCDVSLCKEAAPISVVVSFDSRGIPVFTFELPAKWVTKDLKVKAPGLGVRLKVV